MSAQYDALADLGNFEFHLLFRRREQGSPAWTPSFPSKVKHDFLPIYKGRTLISKLKHFLSGDIRPLLNRYNFDALILHGIYDNSAIWQAIAWCKRNDRPYLLRCDANVAKESTFIRRTIIKPLISRNIRLAAGLLYIGTQNKRYYELFDARDEQLFLAPWEIDYGDLEVYRREALPERLNLRTQLGIHNNECVIITVSRLLHWKGYDTLVPVIGKLAKKGLSVKLVIVGEGPYRTQIEKMVKDYSAPVHLCGNLYRKNVVKTLVASDIFVLVSYREPWGLVVNEAALCGLPLVLSSAVGAGVDLLRPGENGFVVETRCQDSLYDALVKLVRNRVLRESMGQRSRQMITDWREHHCAAVGYGQALASALNLDIS